jgi:hypothetical protein
MPGEERPDDARDGDQAQDDDAGERRAVAHQPPAGVGPEGAPGGQRTGHGFDGKNGAFSHDAPQS